jgi:hypothetical protein
MTGVRPRESSRRDDSPKHNFSIVEPTFNGHS